METNVMKWNDIYFDGDLSEKVMQHLKDLELEKKSKEVLFFLERMFRYMKRAGISGTDFTDEQAQQLNLISKLVEDVWSGFILPFTLEYRHKKLDEYVLKTPLVKTQEDGIFLDIGCGFPPHTTIETSSQLKWKVIGIDPSLPTYLVKDIQGNYATFDEQKKILYFQGSPGKSLDIWDTPQETKKYFITLFNKLFKMLPSESNSGCVLIKDEIGTLVVDPIARYENTNLSFHKGSIGDFEIEDVSVARCFNVLFYFDTTFRENSLRWLSNVLKENGLFICGVNGDHSTRCRHTVYQKKKGSMVAIEFAFSVDNIRPLGGVTWAAFHDDDYETNTLIELVGVLRLKKRFVQKFDKRFDELLREKEMYIRDEDGYLVCSDSNLTPQEKEARKVEVYDQLDKEGYTQAAALELVESGYNAYRNEIGFIAIRLD